ncbi:MAG: phage major capsid protein [Paracoccaceae bacterium]
MKHDKTLPQIAAIKAAGEHFRKKDADPFEAISRKLADHTDAVLERLQEAETKTDGLTEELRTFEQKMARGGGVPEQPKTWGAQFVEGKAAEIGVLAGTSKGAVELNVKTVTTDGASAGVLDVPQRDSMVTLPRRRMTIRQLMQVVSISSGTVEYPVQETRPQGAAPVAEGALKPESDMTFSLQSTGAKVIAHWVKASRQILDDVPQLRDTIDSELTYGLALAEESQILNGDGTGQNLSGLIPNATAFADPMSLLTPTMIDTVGAAILQNALAEYPATGVVVHPADWMRMRLLKDGDGKYILGDPQSNVTPNLFGLPVVPTQAMEVDKFLVGDFMSAGTLYDRWTPRVETAYVEDDFVRNLVTILAEERLAMAVKKPLALTYGDFGNVA